MLSTALFPLVKSAQQDLWSLSILSAVAACFYYSKHKKPPEILLCLNVACHDELKVNCRKYDASRFFLSRRHTVPRLQRGASEASKRQPRTAAAAAGYEGCADDTL